MATKVVKKKKAKKLPPWLAKKGEEEEEAPVKGKPKAKGKGKPKPKKKPPIKKAK